MKEPLVGNEHIDDQSDTEILTSSALDDVVLKNGDVRSPERTTVDDTYIVSNVQPGIYSVLAYSLLHQLQILNLRVKFLALLYLRQKYIPETLTLTYFMPGPISQ